LVASAEAATFGDKPTFVSDSTIQFSYSRRDDYKDQFSLGFTGLEVIIGSAKAQATKDGKIAKVIGKLKGATNEQHHDVLVHLKSPIAPADSASCVNKTSLTCATQRTTDGAFSLS